MAGDGPKIHPSLVDRGRHAPAAPGSDDASGDALLPAYGLWDDDRPKVSDEWAELRRKRDAKFEAFEAAVEKTATLADKLFKVMKEKGLSEARAKCPDCKGWLQGRYSGPRAARFWCDGTCGKQLIS